MKLVRIRMRNFRQHADTSITFTDGLTGIVGANGEGKSTILEAFGWALYGSRAARGTVGSIRWNRAPARHAAEVVLVFAIAGQEYVVTRTETSAEVRMAGAPRPLAEGVAAVNAFVPELLGMSHDEFAATYLCAQKDLAAIGAMKGTARRTFYLGVMGVGRIVAALKLLRARRAALKEQRDGLRLGLGEREPLEVEEAVAAGALRDSARRVEEGVEFAASEASVAASARLDAARWAAARPQHASLAARLAEATRAAGSAREWTARVGGRLLEAEEARERVEAAAPRVAELPALRARAAALQSAQDSAGERAALVARADSVANEIEQLRAHVAEARRTVAAFNAGALDAARERFSVADHAFRAAEADRFAQRSTAQADARAAWTAATRNEKRLAAIEAAGDEGACPTCLRELRDAFAHVVEVLNQELAAEREKERSAGARALELASASAREAEMENAARRAGAEVRDLESAEVLARGAGQALERAAAAIARLEEEGATLQVRVAALPIAEVDPAQLRAARDAVAAAEQVLRDTEPDRALVASIPDLEADLRRWTYAQADAQAQADAAVGEIATLGFDQAAADQAAVALASAVEAERTAREALVRAQGAEEAASQRLARAEAALADYDRRADVLREVGEQLATCEAGDRLLDGFRSHEVAAIRPELEELTSAMVAQMTDGRFESVLLDQDFNAVPQRGGMGMDVVSGGEEDVVALAMRLATSQMVAERAGHPLSLLILDEPFGSQDEVRRQNMLALIRRLGGVFEQVLVISHVDDVREAVDQALVVRYDEATGRSVVEECQAPGRMEAAA